MKYQNIVSNTDISAIIDTPYFPRKFDSVLLEWKGRRGLPLVIKGLRQSGKTKTILNFAKSNYANVLYIDFRNHPDYRSIFSDYDVDAMKLRISAIFPEFTFAEKDTILIFDEIQDCPIARGSLKNFAIDCRYDVIATGSMLGLSGYSREESYVPVGYEDIRLFHPMDFEEFLQAMGMSREVLALLKGCLKNEAPVDTSIHESLLKYFRYYLLVGGMPSAVRTFLDSHDLSQVRKEQQRLMASYRDDFGKHLDSEKGVYEKEVEKAKIDAVLDSLPEQLGKPSGTKFVYNVLKDSHAKGQKYQGAIQWLVDYGLLLRCSDLTAIDMVPKGYVNPSQFKLYFADMGLLVSQLDPSIAKAILLDDFAVFRGFIYENAVADAFSKSGRDLYYYSPNGHTEIDFITLHQGHIALTEVKAKSGRTKSSTAFLSAVKDRDRYLLLRMTKENIRSSPGKLTIPYYLAGFLPSEEESLRDIPLDFPDLTSINKKESK